MTPSSEPLSVRRLPEMPPVDSGICFALRMLRRRDTESGEMPAAVKPIESVFRRVARSLERWPSWYAMLPRTP